LPVIKWTGWNVKSAGARAIQKNKNAHGRARRTVWNLATGKEAAWLDNP